MQTSAQLRARLDEIDAERRSIHEAAGEQPLSEDQQTRWDELDTEHVQLRRDLADAQIAEERAERTAQSRAKWGSLSVGSRKNPWDDLDSLRFASELDVQERALTAIEQTSYRGLARVSDEARQQATVLVEDHPEIARRMMLTGSPDYMQAFRSYMKSQGSPVYTASKAGLTAYFENPVRRISRVESGTQDKWHGVTVAGVTTAWKSEGSAFTDGSPTTGEVVVDAAMLTAYVTGSFEIFQDSNFLTQIPTLIGEAIDFAESDAFVSGSGSDAPKGIVTCLSGTAGVTVTATTRGSFTIASAADTLALLNALPVRYEDTATWLMNKATRLTINQQIIGTGAVIVSEMLTSQRELLELPVVKASAMASATTSGNHLIVLGDFSQFVIYDRLGVNVEFVQNVVDGDGLPVGKRGLVAYKRVGSNVSDQNAFRALKA